MANIVKAEPTQEELIPAPKQPKKTKEKRKESMPGKKKSTDTPLNRSRRMVRDPKSKVKKINNKNHLYCHGLFGYWPFTDFTKDPRYSDKYLASKGK